MKTEYLDEWAACREATAAMVDVGKRIGRSLDGLAEYVRLGYVNGAEGAARKLLEEVENLAAAIQRLNTPPQISPAMFASQIESSARSSAAYGQIVRRDHRLLIGSTGVRISEANNGELIAVVGKETLRTSSTYAVLSEVTRQEKEKFDHKRLIKALREAFMFHVALRDASVETAVVPLEDVRRLISNSRDGMNYSIEHLTDDIQRLATGAHEEMLDAGIDFIPVPAARVQFEFIEQTGNITHLGGIRIRRQTRVEA